MTGRKIENSDEGGMDLTAKPEGTEEVTVEQARQIIAITIGVEESNLELKEGFSFTLNPERAKEIPGEPKGYRFEVETNMVRRI